MAQSFRLESKKSDFSVVIDGGKGGYIVAAMTAVALPRPDWLCDAIQAD